MSVVQEEELPNLHGEFHYNTAISADSFKNDKTVIMQKELADVVEFHLGIRPKNIKIEFEVSSFKAKE